MSNNIHLKALFYKFVIISIMLISIGGIVGYFSGHHIISFYPEFLPNGDTPTVPLADMIGNPTIKGILIVLSFLISYGIIVQLQIENQIKAIKYTDIKISVEDTINEYVKNFKWYMPWVKEYYGGYKHWFYPSFILLAILIYTFQSLIVILIVLFPFFWFYKKIRN